MRHSRRGFTLVEILVVIGIILVLMGLLVAGFRHVSEQAAQKETKTELQNCASMLNEYSGHNGLANIEVYATVQTSDPTAAAPGKFPVFMDPASTLSAVSYGTTWKTGAAAGTYWPCLIAPTALPVAGPGDDFSSANQTDLGAASQANYPRYVSNAVNYTRDVMHVLIRIPANRTIMQTVPSKRVLEAYGGTPTVTIDQGVVLLDGWGNPIIFVPRGGMHTLIKDQTSGNFVPYLVRSTGIFSTPSGTQDPPMTGSERPFFASAGQDGDFTLGEDNVYSFQQ